MDMNFLIRKDYHNLKAARIVNKVMNAYLKEKFNLNNQDELNKFLKDNPKLKEQLINIEGNLLWNAVGLTLLKETYDNDYEVINELINKVVLDFPDNEKPKTITQKQVLGWIKELNLDITKKSKKPTGNQIYELTSGKIIIEFEKHLGYSFVEKEKEVIETHIKKIRNEIKKRKK